eukprot:6530505-Prymnesium_polylepis.1
MHVVRVHGEHGGPMHGVELTRLGADVDLRCPASPASVKKYERLIMDDVVDRDGAAHVLAVFDDPDGLAVRMETAAQS